MRRVLLRLVSSEAWQNSWEWKNIPNCFVILVNSVSYLLYHYFTTFITPIEIFRVLNCDTHVFIEYSPD